MNKKQNKLTAYEISLLIAANIIVIVLLAAGVWNVVQELIPITNPLPIIPADFSGTDCQKYITEDFYLLSEIEVDGQTWTLKWKSDSELYDVETGKVTRPEDKNADINLQALITSGPMTGKTLTYKATIVKSGVAELPKDAIIQQSELDDGRIIWTTESELPAGNHEEIIALIDHIKPNGNTSEDYLMLDVEAVVDTEIFQLAKIDKEMEMITSDGLWIVSDKDGSMKVAISSNQNQKTYQPLPESVEKSLHKVSENYEILYIQSKSEPNGTLRFAADTKNGEIALYQYNTESKAVSIEKTVPYENALSEGNFFNSAGLAWSSGKDLSHNKMNSFCFDIISRIQRLTNGCTSTKYIPFCDEIASMPDSLQYNTAVKAIYAGTRTSSEIRNDAKYHEYAHTLFMEATGLSLVYGAEMAAAAEGFADGLACLMTENWTIGTKEDSSNPHRDYQQAEKSQKPECFTFANAYENGEFLVGRIKALQSEPGTEAAMEILCLAPHLGFSPEEFYDSMLKNLEIARQILGY